MTKSTPFGSIDAPFNPVVAGARRRGDVRRAHDRHRQAAPAGGAARGGRARGRGAGRDLPELPGLQRRRVRRAARQEARRGQPDPARARRADPLRRRARGAADGEPADRGGERRGPLVVHDAHRDDPSLRVRALAASSLTPDGPTPIGIFRDVKRPVSGRDLTHELARRGRVRTTPSWTPLLRRRGYVDDLPSARRSEKWTKYPPDVLPAWVAEMDFALAPPIKAALHARGRASTTSATSARADGAARGVRGLHCAPAGLDGRPGHVALVTDVMVGVEESAAAC